MASVQTNEAHKTFTNPTECVGLKFLRRVVNRDLHIHIASMDGAEFATNAKHIKIRTCGVAGKRMDKC